MRITALLAAHNRRPKTLACLASYLSQEVPGDVTLSAVLVDDGSTDGTAEAVRERFPEARVIAGSGHLFWAAAMAIAEREARRGEPDFLLWLNDDATLEPGALSTLIETAESSGEGGCIVVGALRDPRSGELTYSGVRRTGAHPLRFTQVPPGDRATEVDTFNGNVVLVSRAAFERIGSIDGGFAHATADYDYGLRARSAGIPVLLAPGTIGTCPHNPSTEPWADPALTLRGRIRVLTGRKGIPPRSSARYLRRHGGPAWPLFWLSPYIRAVPSLIRPHEPERTTAPDE
jgi:GT2 family glycosyltransferase